MAKLAQHVQVTVIHVQVILFVKLVKQDMDFKVINVIPVLQELILMVKSVQHVQVPVIPAQAIQFVKHVKADMGSKVINAAFALQELI